MKRPTKEQIRLIERKTGAAWQRYDSLPRGSRERDAAYRIYNRHLNSERKMKDRFNYDSFTPSTGWSGTKNRFHSVDEMTHYSSRKGSHYFDKSAMKFFGSRIGKIYGGVFFVESVKPPYGSRYYRVCAMTPKGTVKRVQDNIPTSAKANTIAKNLAKHLTNYKY